MNLNIEAVGPSKSGKALRVKVGNDWYGANKDSGLMPGMVIDAIVEDGQYGKWITAWKKAQESAVPQVSPKTQVERTGAAPSPSAGAAPVWGNFVSNQVAHAIQAGLITNPGDLKIWAAAAKLAFEELNRDTPF